MGRGIIELRKKLLLPAGKGSMVTAFPSYQKGVEEWKQTQKKEKEEKNITQKLIILHYDYVVYSLTMRSAIGAKDHRARKERRVEKKEKARKVVKKVLRMKSAFQ